jgi:hypothetical protein
MSEPNLAPSRVLPSPKAEHDPKPVEEFFITHDPLTGWPIDDPRDDDNAPL